MFAHTSSAHEVSPTYACDSGEPNGDNECVATTRIAPTVTYSCAEGTPNDNNECERTIETDAAASCSTGSPDGGRCLHTASPTYSCSSGRLSGTRCLHTASPTYSCSSGSLSGTRCLHAANPTYSCSSGSLSGSQCLHTASPAYSCSSGTLSGSQCQTTTSATASCSSGSLSGGQCLHVVSANPGCPSGYQAGPFDTCYRYTSPTYSCSSGTLSGTSCITTTPANASCRSGYLTGAFGICYKYTAASSSCPAGYGPPTLGICFRYTAAAASCQTGFTLSGGQCTRKTAATPSCSAGYKLGSFTLLGSVVTYCYKHTAPDYTCSTGTLSGDKYLTTTTVDATPRYSCPTEYELERLTILGSPVTYCTRTTTTDATPNCSEGTWNGTTCAHTHPGPVISGLDAAGTSAAGTDYTDNFTVAPTTATVLLSGAGCFLSGTAGFYTLTARRADAGTRTCTIAAVDTTSATAAATITFTTRPAPVISGLDATGTSAAGTDYTDNFTVAPTTATVLASGAGCELSGTAGSYTLTARRADAGTRTCTITAGTTTATATITFTTGPVISGLDAAGESAAGTDYTDDFTVAPTTATVLLSGAGCFLSGTAGSYTLTARRADAGTRTCTIAAVDTTSATAAATITFTAVVVHTRRPKSPRNLRCTAATATTATWTWEAADRAHSYWYRYSRSGDWAQAGGQDARSHTRTGITPRAGVGGWNNWRYFYVKATNNAGDSSQNPGSCLTLPPGWLSAECSSTGHITVTWPKPLGLDSVSTVRYTGAITDPDGGALARHDGTGTTLTGTGTPGTTYNIAVSTQPIANKPAYSETTTAECEPGPPPAPAGLECTQDLTDLLAPYATECTWSAVTSTVTSRYRLQTRWLKSDGAWTLPLSVTSPATSVVRALAARTYQARVQANQPTEGAWSDWTESFEIVVPPPPAPTGVVVECTTGNDVVVKWVPSSGASQYKVAVTARPPAPGRPSTEDHTVPHQDVPAGQKVSLPVPGKIGWDYTATVTSVNTSPEPDLESAAAASAGGDRCEGVQVVCQADGRLKTTWVRNTGATQYRLRISVTATTSTQVATLPDILVAQPAQATRTISHYRDAVVGKRYEVRVAAQTGGVWSADSAPAADTCTAVAPPAPTGVTASCSNDVLTVEWESAGTGLAKATSYKPRIFTGTSMTPDTRWTANATGTATSATLPAANEDDLPETGVFQVKVKATNTAGDSPYSTATDASCEASCPHSHDDFGCHGVEIMHECGDGEHRDPNLMGPITGFLGCHPAGDTHECPSGRHFHNESDHHFSSCHADHDVGLHPVPEMVIGVHSAEIERSLRSRLNSRVQFPRLNEADTAAIFEVSQPGTARATSDSDTRSAAGGGGECLKGQHSHVLVSGCHAADTEHPGAPWTIVSGNGVVPAEHLVELVQEPTPTPAPTSPDGADSGSSTSSGRTSRASSPIDQTGVLWATVTLDFNFNKYQCMRWHEGSRP